MTHLRKLTAVLLAVIMVFALAACGQKDADTAVDKDLTVNVVALNGTTGFGMAKLMSDSKAGTTALSYNFTVETDPSNATAALVNGTADIAALPTNAAAALYNKTDGGVKIIALGTLGVLHILESGGGTSIHSVSDLAGKTIWSAGQGANPEYVLRYLLTANGLDPDKDVDIQYYSEATEVTAQMATTQDAIAVLPQPYVTAAGLKDDTLRVALDLTAEWDKVADTQLITGVTVVRKAYAEEHPDVVAAFLADYAQSVNAANTDLDGTAALCEEQGVVAKAAIAKKALPNCNIVCLTGEELKADVSGYLQVLYDADPAAVGGTLPGEDFYWTAQ